MEYKCQSQDNIEMPSSSSSSSTYTNSENSSSSGNDEPSKIRKKKSNQFGEMQQEFSLFKAMIQKKKNSRKYAWLGTLVANQMEEIDHDKQQSAAWQIQTIIKRYIDESKHRTPASLATSSSSDKDEVSDKDDFCCKILKRQKSDTACKVTKSENQSGYET